jgi:DNA repair protein RadD
MTDLAPLWPHQQAALDRLEQALEADEKWIMVRMPTGAGKTRLAARKIRSLLEAGKRVAFCVPSISLIAQTITALEADGLDQIGVVQAGHWRADNRKPIQVCSVQTIGARNLQPFVDLVFVDEGHLLFAAIAKWMSDKPNLPFVGLSATPWSRGLGRLYATLIDGPTTAELIEQGRLARFVTFAPSTFDTADVRTVAGEFHQGQLGAAVDQVELVADVVETWRKRGENRPTICFGTNRQHAEHLQQRFVEAGIPAEYLDCFSQREEREETFDRFRSGETRILCNVNVLAAGVDFPGVGCVIDARPTKSEIRYVQTIGRGLRTAPGKDKLIILDHSGNALRLGLVTDVHHHELDRGDQRGSGAEQKAERSEPLPRLCEECKAVIPARSKVCDQCGHVREARSLVTHKDGELVELGSHERVKTFAATFEAKATFYGELLWYANSREFKPGWAAHKFKEKFGGWPDWAIKNAKPVEPSLATKNWIRSRQIAYARARNYG